MRNNLSQNHNLFEAKTKKILVIEDESTIRRVIVKILADEGFNVISADTGNLGIEMAFKELPDLIICDIMLPILDGYSILSQLRQNSATAIVPFIFLTSKDERSDWRLGMQLGADDYLTKPFTRAELLDAIATRFVKQEAIQQQYNTALEEATEKLNHLLYYDSSTHLPNRLLLQEWFEEKRHGVERSQPIPIVTLNIDKFGRLEAILETKKIDVLLQKLAERLISYVGKSNIVARLNIAQLAIILADWDSLEQGVDAQLGDSTNRELTARKSLELNSQSSQFPVPHFAQKILDILSLPFLLDSDKIFITISMGIAVYPDDGYQLDLLLKHSLAALHQAKYNGGNCYHFYTTAMLSKSKRYLALANSLRSALERDEFQVYYQPKVDTQTMAIIGAEALLRWQHPDWGTVSPAEFISIAEETGLILPIGQWVLQTACQQAHYWQAAGFSLSVAVNLSAQQFNEPKLSKLVIQALESASLDPKWLDLELTESTLVKNPANAIATLSELKKLGIQISVDDFGTGYSSLSYLKQFPFDNLKIDRYFVRNLTDDPKNAAITTALIQLAHSLNLKVIAEGVETEAELAFLSQHQCDVVQGYLFGKPVPAAEFNQLLIEERRRLASTCK